MISEARLDQAAVEIAAEFARERIEAGQEPLSAELDAVELLAELLFELRDA
ncbi:hypothetical protein [Frigoribacterium sp. UYMn621]|uniref:hypothetical protein n=1 Tax=Frigoribacterium sp. UYMn621 TaxID=3156343 RepID=UPI003393E902